MELENLLEIARELPETVRANALALVEEMGTVVEGIGDEPVAWKPGFLRLVQGTTDRSTLPKGTAIGDFVLGETRLENPIEFIPLRMWDARQYWDPDQNNNRMLCNSPDAKLGYIGTYCRQCPHAEWKEGEGSDCNKIKSMLAITADLRTIFSVNFAKSSYKAGMELEGYLKKAGVAPYRRTYALTNSPSATAKNVETFKAELLTGDKRTTPAEHTDFLKGLFDTIQADRKAMLDKFYEIAIARGQQAPQIGNDADTVIKITDESSPVTTTTVEAEVPAKVSAAAKNYSV